MRADDAELAEPLVYDELVKIRSIDMRLFVTRVTHIPVHLPWRRKGGLLGSKGETG